MSDLVPPMMPDDLDALIQTMERVQQLESELAKLRLTDAEREAIWAVAEAYAENDGDPECERIARVMQGLWQRTK
jgi:hypothetical protein